MFVVSVELGATAMTLSTTNFEGFKPCCPECGQPMLMKFGVRFQPKSASMLNRIEDATKGRGGIECETLAYVFFPGVPKKVAQQRVRTHVWQINEMLVSTNWRVVNARKCKHEGALYQLKEVA